MGENEDLHVCFIEEAGERGVGGVANNYYAPIMSHTFYHLSKWPNYEMP